MHILLLVLGTIATLVFYLGRISRGASDVADAAQTLSNIPRRRRHAKAVNMRGLALVQSPVEAATMLMLSISRMSDDRRLSDRERMMIEQQLVSEMRLEADQADGMILQMEMIQDEITLPESTLFPMVDILLDTIERDDARRLAGMLNAVAEVHGKTHEQLDFIRRYRDRMGLLG